MIIFSDFMDKQNIYNCSNSLRYSQSYVKKSYETYTN